jgi:hypothetical protein
MTVDPTSLRVSATPEQATIPYTGYVNEFSQVSQRIWRIYSLQCHLVKLVGSRIVRTSLAAFLAFPTAVTPRQFSFNTISFAEIVNHRSGAIMLSANEKPRRDISFKLGEQETSSFQFAVPN